MGRRDTGIEKTDAGEIEIALVVEFVIANGERLPNIGPLFGDGHGVELAEFRKAKIFRKDADDFEDVVIEQDVSADGGGIGGEPRGPETMADDDDMVAAGAVFVG